MNARTAVVLVHYKNIEDTTKCIQSLAKSTRQGQIVIVDNSPFDPTLDIVLASYQDIRVIKAPENLGFAKGNNRGIEWVIRNTACEFIFILNNDTTIDTTAIAKLEYAMDAHPTAGVATGRIVYEENPLALWYGGGEVDWRKGAAKAPGYLGRPDAPLAMTPRYVTFASGCAMMVRRQVVERLGGFDERFFMYEEDLEWCFRISESGWQIWYEPSVLILHREHGSMKGTSKHQTYTGSLSPENPNLPFHLFHIVRNRLLNMHLHAHGRNRAIFLFWFPIFISWKIMNFALHGRTDVLSVVPDAWRSYRKTVAGVS